MLRRPLFVGFLLIAFCLLVLYGLGVNLEEETSLDRALGDSSCEATIQGTVLSVREGNYGDVVSLESCAVFLKNGVDAPGEQLSTHGLIVYGDTGGTMGPGDLVLVEGTIKSFPKPDNPGEFNKRLYYRTSGFDYQVTATSVSVISKSSGLKNVLNKVKTWLAESIESVSEDENEAGLFRAILLGDRTGLDDETYELFKVSGIAHILAISGLHLSLVAAAILGILKSLRVPRVLASLVSEGLLLAYVLMIDGSSSAWRALIMFSLSLVAPLVGRTYDMLSALAVSGLMMLLRQPLLIADSGFLLSFGAIGSIGLLYPVLSSSFNFKKASAPVKKGNLWERILKTIGLKEKTDDDKNREDEDKKNRKNQRYDRRVRWIYRPFLLSFSIQIGTLPIVAHSYFTITPYGIVLNLIALPLVSLAMLSVSLGALGGLLYLPLGVFFAGGAHVIFAGLIGLCRIVSELPGASLVMGDPAWWKIGLYYGSLALIVFLVKNRERKAEASGTARAKAAASGDFGCKTARAKANEIGEIFTRYKLGHCLALLMLICVLWVVPFGARDPSINALYVGQGDSTVIFGDEGECVIIDCGSSDKSDVAGSVILPFLKSKGVSHVDLIILSHGDKDHVSGLEGILSDPAITVGAVAMSEEASTQGGESKSGVPGASILTTSTATASGTSASSGYSLTQDWSAIIKMVETYGAATFFLSAGDLLEVGALKFEVISPEITRAASTGIVAASATAASLAFEDENDNSLVVLMKYGEFSGLFTGDISSTAEAALVDYEYVGKVNYLKCPHHGSKYSSSAAFLKTLAPDVVTISAGRNNLYGHPSDVTLRRLAEANLAYFRTDRQGAVEIAITATGIQSVTTFIYSE